MVRWESGRLGTAVVVNDDLQVGSMVLLEKIAKFCYADRGCDSAMTARKSLMSMYLY